MYFFVLLLIFKLVPLLKSLKHNIFYFFVWNHWKWKWQIWAKTSDEIGISRGKPNQCISRNMLFIAPFHIITSDIIPNCSYLPKSHICIFFIWFYLIMSALMAMSKRRRLPTETGETCLKLSTNIANFFLYFIFQEAYLCNEHFLCVSCILLMFALLLCLKKGALVFENFTFQQFFFIITGQMNK